jgi:PmbA protein
MSDLRAVADAACRALTAQGIAGCVAVSASDGWRAVVRGGVAEQVSAATSAGLRVTAYADGDRTAAVSGSDLSPGAIQRLVDEAVVLARLADPDPWGGLPDPAWCGEAAAELDLDDPAGIARCAVADGIAAVAAAESAAQAAEPRIRTTHRSAFSARRGHGVLADTRGLRQESRATRFGLHLTAIAEIDGVRHQGSDATAARYLADLRPPDAVGRLAAERAVRYAGWRRPPTGRYPVLFHREAAGAVLQLVGQAAWGGAVYRGATFWAGAVGTAVASPLVTVVDDPLVRRGLGSRTSDSDGVRAASCTVVADGVLQSYLTDSVAARRLGVAATGHGGGTSNLILRPGAWTWDALVRELGTGLLVADLVGAGLDLAGGRWSQGATGWWVEAGRIVHPVMEATIACDLRELFRGIRAVGDDPETETTASSPALLADGCTVSAQTPA